MNDRQAIRRERARSADSVLAVYCLLALFSALASLILLYDVGGWGLPAESAIGPAQWLAVSGAVYLFVGFLWSLVLRSRN